MVDGPVTAAGGGGTMMRDGEVVVLGINIVLLIPTTALTTMLLANQGWYLLYNITTIEAIEKSDMPFAFNGQVSKIPDPYDLGYIRNISAVLGKRWYLWLCPGVSPESDGYSFPIGKNAKERIMDREGVDLYSLSNTSMVNLGSGDTRHRNHNESPSSQRSNSTWEAAILIDEDSSKEN
ncbi:hypothetical protein HDU97_008394 [Phlyctochytrium planicorne]|nr:hypothetical protein HDU97_008394 [Phlyctochytrium planicorne]